MTPKRIGILVVAYNAATTLAEVLDRIPADFRSSITTVIVGDDHSQDQTHLVAMGYQQLPPDLPLVITRHEANLGYGGNQKWGYRAAIEADLDVIVLLHGDGQYAPEMLPDMVAPLLADEADAVFGSRMMVEGGARRGGMPLYKYVGNRILTTVENAVAGVDLTEWHSGYRAYSVAALRATAVRAQQRRLRLRHADHPPADRVRAAHRRDPDPDLLRRRDLPRQRSEVREGHHRRGVPLPGAQDGLRHGRAGVRERCVRAEGRRGVLAPHPVELAVASFARPHPRPRAAPTASSPSGCASRDTG